MESQLSQISAISIKSLSIQSILTSTISSCQTVNVSYVASASVPPTPQKKGDIERSGWICGGL